jgi:hypothetical protein
VASERQIAANRRNACKSTGPIVSGKGRASSNAYRHGLSLRVGASAPLAAKLEKRARKIAGNTDDPVTLERAREIVQAEHDLARVRQAKVALIERTRAFAAADRPEGLGLSAEAVRGLLLELLRLDRYERRAAAQRDRAVLDLSDRIKCDDNR